MKKKNEERDKLSNSGSAKKELDLARMGRKK